MKGFVKMNMKSIISGLAAVALLGVSTMLHAQNGMAMTWKSKKAVVLGNNKIVVVGCSGCDAYKGDTKVNQKLRILCIVPGNEPEPAAYAAFLTTNNLKKFYYNWSGGRIGLTKKVKGETITSQAVADQKCKTDLNDSQARMIEHHDNKVGGWSLGGFVHNNSKAKGQLRNPNKMGQNKYWARINDTPANPWD